MSGLTHKQIFFAIWLGIVAISVFMMASYYRRVNRSNFRRPGDGPPPPKINVDARRLGGGAEKGLVVKANTPDKKR